LHTEIQIHQATGLPWLMTSCRTKISTFITTELQAIHLPESPLSLLPHCTFFPKPTPEFPMGTLPILHHTCSMDSRGTIGSHLSRLSL
jgi:hypothetical protein